MSGTPHIVLGLILGLPVGIALGLLGGGGSILAVPIFLYVFGVPPKPAIAMSLAVVGMSALVGFVTHWRQGTVNLRVAIPFGLFAMGGAFATARVAARFVPESVQLTLFAAFAATVSILMLRDRRGDSPGVLPENPRSRPGVRKVLAALQGVGVGVLTSLIGAGGGFLIVPALTLFARIPVKVAVGSSLLIIAMNAAAGFVGYVGQVEIAWALVASFTAVAAVGAVLGTRLALHVPQRRIRQAFAVMILVLGVLVVAQKLARM